MGLSMTFAYEQEMEAPVTAWLHAQKLMVKRQFPTPWGVCDLVGCALDARKVRRRLALGQRKCLRSQVRVHLLSLIPDRSEARSIGLDELHARFGGFLSPSRIEDEVGRLVDDRFVEEVAARTYCRRDRWLPMHRRLVAVELKLARTDDALAQAVNNLGFSEHSYVALPRDRARRLLKTAVKSAFAARGIGVLAVTADTCRTLLKPRRPDRPADRVVQYYCVERFWQQHLRCRQL